MSNDCRVPCRVYVLITNNRKTLTFAVGVFVFAFDEKDIWDYPAHSRKIGSRDWNSEYLQRHTSR
ncbi:hypothetical protein CCS41_00435 [Candidatus Fukatsuia symbiotica]|uniref:Uncharacterized protein n=1 Tax=Candidatus Fukatsuia symbiotica TaxID=1878942 RepID=A0A2U8I538_9GAMM|nr:hypothetical protein [Candidatus Fukatsuia symbiotica]AWK13305.1 hypothetical protein CCS41_00435 [Candidatus Fukatsuia symbiotica]